MKETTRNLYYYKILADSLITLGHSVGKRTIPNKVSQKMGRDVHPNREVTLSTEMLQNVCLHCEDVFLTRHPLIGLIQS